MIDIYEVILSVHKGFATLRVEADDFTITLNDQTVEFYKNREMVACFALKNIQGFTKIDERIEDNKINMTGAKLWTSG